MKQEEVHHIGRTLPTSETDSHRGARTPRCRAQFGQLFDEGDLVDANSTWFP